MRKYTLRRQLYAVWYGMKRRCYDARCKEYVWYGVRGIVVENEWKESFQDFYSWAVTNGFESGLSIDRKDNDKNYCPDNCRWATAKEQAANTRNAKLLTINGTTLPINGWARRIGMSPVTIRSRIAAGWETEAILAPTNRSRGDHTLRLKAAKFDHARDLRKHEAV